MPLGTINAAEVEQRKDVDSVRAALGKVTSVLSTMRDSPALQPSQVQRGIGDLAEAIEIIGNALVRQLEK